MYTIKDILKLKPCKDYTEEKLEELWKGKESLALREILELDIDIKDRNWVVAQLVSTEIVIKWAHLCAHKAKKHADNAAATADKSTADRAAWAARSAANAADAAWSAKATAANAANAAANAAARSAAGYAAVWSENKNKDKELYRLLTILCNMEEESK